MPPDNLALVPTRARRLPRFRRASLDERPAFRLTERDRELLRIVYEYRFITAEMLQDLVPPVELTEAQQKAVEDLITKRRAKLSGTKAADQSNVRMKRKIWHRVMVLFHGGYLQRQKLSDQEPIVYSLGNLGADELTLYYGIDRQKIDWTTKAREAGERYIRHGLMVSRFRHAFELALRTMPDVTVEKWIPGGGFKAKLRHQETVRTREGTRTQLVDGVVKPDSLFVVKNGEKRIHYFLEADRSTMTNGRYREKLKSYYAFYSKYVRDDDKKKAGITQMRVLTLTISDARKDNLRETAQLVSSEAKCLFWFACERSYRDEPQKVISSVWQTLKDETFNSLYEHG